MKSKKAVCALIALSLMTGPYALAQGNSDNDRNNRDHQKQGQRADEQGRRNLQRQPPNRAANPAYGNNNQRYQEQERGAGPDHAFHRGGRLPIQYRSHQYVVEDWRSHNLSAPPRGYHWVQSGSDYVLVAIATGIILQLLLNN
jgi:Ni/Co efflux regulator RcnB